MSLWQQHKIPIPACKQLCVLPKYQPKKYLLSFSKSKCHILLLTWVFYSKTVTYAFITFFFVAKEAFLYFSFNHAIPLWTITEQLEKEPDKIRLDILHLKELCGYILFQELFSGQLVSVTGSHLFASSFFPGFN